MKELFIRDDEMPKSCAECRITKFFDCEVYNPHDDCPLRPLSEARGECEVVCRRCSRCNSRIGAPKQDNFCAICGARIKHKGEISNV